MTRRGRRLALASSSLAVAAVMWGAAFLHPDATGYGDWQWFHQMWEVGRVAVLRFHEVPLYNPNHCGGVPLWGNPQAQVYSPAFWLLGLTLGTTIGLKVFVVLHAAVGAAGMFVFARRELAATRIGAWGAALVWTCCGFFAWHGSGGHATYLPFYFAPWILLSFRRAVREPVHACGVALWMGLVIFEGGHYTFPFLVLLLAFDALARVGKKPEDTLRVARAAALSGVLTALLAAMRVVPILIIVRRYQRDATDGDRMKLSELVEIFTGREQHAVWPHHRWVWAEFGSYVGWTVVACAGVGILVTLFRKRLRDLPVGVLLFALYTMGHVAKWFPWPLTQHLPVYATLRVPSRFAVLTSLYLAMLVAVGLTWLAAATARRFGPRVGRVAAALTAVLALGMGVDMLSVNLAVVDRWNGPPLDADVPGAEFYLTPGLDYYARYASYPARNVGTAECYDPVPWPRARGLWFGPGLQARVDAGDGRVRAAGRTNVTSWADVSMRGPGRIVFDQNFIPGLVSDVGHAAADEGGRLVVDVPAGDRRVTVRYRPEDLPWSALTSLATLVGIVVALSIRLRRRRRA